MPIPVLRVSSVPSIGTMSKFNDLSSLDRQEDLNYYLRRAFAPRGGSDYFGSKYDRYYRAFSSTIDRHFCSVGKASRRLRDGIISSSTEDMIRPCITEETLRRLPPKMYVPVLTEPHLWPYYRQGRVQGFANITPESIEPERARWTRLIDTNGLLNTDPDVPEDQEQTVSWEYHEDDPELTAQQIVDIRHTRDYIRYLIEETDSDPTDMDENRM